MSQSRMKLYIMISTMLIGLALISMCFLTRRGVESFTNYTKTNVRVNNISSNVKDVINVSNLKSNKHINLKNSNIAPISTLTIGSGATENTILTHRGNSKTKASDLVVGTKDKDLDFTSSKVTFNKPVTINKPNSTLKKGVFKGKVTFDDSVEMSSSRIPPKICFGDTSEENCITEEEIKKVLLYDSCRGKFMNFNQDYRPYIELLRTVFMPIDKGTVDCTRCDSDDNVDNENKESSTYNDITSNSMRINENMLVEKICQWVTGTGYQ